MRDRQDRLMDRLTAVSRWTVLALFVVAFIGSVVTSK